VRNDKLLLLFEIDTCHAFSFEDIDQSNLNKSCHISFLDVKVWMKVFLISRMFLVQTFNY
jgi:hypothetical protein